MGNIQGRKKKSILTFVFLTEKRQRQMKIL